MNKQQQNSNCNIVRLLNVSFIILFATTLLIDIILSPINVTLNYSYVEVKQEKGIEDIQHELLIDKSMNSQTNHITNITLHVRNINSNLRKNLKEEDELNNKSIISATNVKIFFLNSSDIKDNVKSKHIISSSKKEIQKIRRRDILKRSRMNIFEDFHLWSQYLHFLIYRVTPKEKHAVNFVDQEGNPIAYEGYPYKPPQLCEKKTDITCDRGKRFPSVQDRIKFYMGKWYDSEPNGIFYSDVFINGVERHLEKVTNVLDYHEGFGRLLINPFEMSPRAMFRNYASGYKQNDKFRNGRNYLRDIIDLAILHNKSSTPVLIHYGDGLSSAGSRKLIGREYPVFGKVRDVIAEKDEENHWRYPSGTRHCRQCGKKHSNIIWPLNRGRHFSTVATVPNKDIPWDMKISKAVWRGRIEKEDLANADLPYEISSWRQRLELVRSNLDSKIIDAKFTGKIKSIPQGYIGEPLHLEEMLKYKYLVSIEGNDVSSGLKWMLFSNSVVLTPPITWESWAMETFLKPFVHYIPIHANMSNVDEMISWAESHQEECQTIVKRSTLFIYDLLFHPDAYKDEEVILSSIIKRYEDIFGNGGTSKTI